MPARRRKRRTNNTKINLRKYLIYLLSAILLLISVVLIVKFKSGNSIWNSDEKLGIAVDNNDDGVVVVLLDPEQNSIYKINLPENLEIESANNLGTWKIGSLWELGEDEGMDGKLLQYTVSKSLKMPVYAWSDQQLLALLDGGMVSGLPELFSITNETNLSLLDRLKILRFSTRVENSKNVEYTIDEIDFISESTLKDGTKGYVVNREPGVRLLSLFADDYISSRPNRAVIISSAENNWKAKQLGEVLEVIGVKIAAIREETHEVSYCEVSSKDIVVAANISRYFDCDYNTKTNTNFDVEIRIGDKFTAIY